MCCCLDFVLCFFSFSFFHDNYRWQKPDGLHWKLYDHCCVWVDFSLRYSSTFIIQLEKKYSFPIFGWIPAWRNGSWFRTYLIGFSQEEINERRRTDGTNQWWVWEPEGRNPTKKWVELKLTKVSHPLPPKYLMIFQSSITPLSEWWALHFQKSSLLPQIILGNLNLCSTHYFMDHGAPKKFG